MEEYSWQRMDYGKRLDDIKWEDRGHWEGEYTYVGARGCSIIDYIIVNETIGDSIYKFKVGEKVDSDHLSLEVELSTEEKRTQEEQKRMAEEEEKEIIVWDTESRRIGKRRKN